MNWISELCDLYEKNQELAGKVERGRYGEPLILLPIFHTTVAAQVTVTIDTEGGLLDAERVDAEDKLTVIPVTEKSASRTAGVEPHPLCDNLKYLAEDYHVFIDAKNGKDFSENHKRYMEGLKKWDESDFSHEKVRAIRKYLGKGRLIRDLIDRKVLMTDENGVVSPKEKIQNVAQTDAFVRFKVEPERDVDRNILLEREYYVPDECWLDLSLQASYIAFTRNTVTKKGLSYLTGEQTAISYLHPKKIRNEGDGSKLISANDETNFTFLGRFASKEEAFAIGYEDSQKAHNALKWIIRKQGRSWNGLTVVTWASDAAALPEWYQDSDRICDLYEGRKNGEKEGNEKAEETEIAGNEYEGWEDAEESDAENNADKPAYQGTDTRTAARFLAAIEGYRSKLDAASNMMLMAFDSATPGRLSIMQCQKLASSVYLKNLEAWHCDCGWIQVRYKNNRFYQYYGMVNMKDIAGLLYGTEEKNTMVLKGSNEKMSAEVCKRLLPCVILRSPIPQDMVNLAVRRASSPVSFENRMIWEQILALACSLVKKKLIEKNDKEVWSVALNEQCCDRDYLYGRLLAVADRVEYRSQETNEVRETNAKRFMSAFSQQPFRTWKMLEERIEPYMLKLSVEERLRYEHLIDEICWKFAEGDFEKGDALNGRYLLGFHNQAYAFRNRKEEKKDE